MMGSGADKPRRRRWGEQSRRGVPYQENEVQGTGAAWLGLAAGWGQKDGDDFERRRHLGVLMARAEWTDAEGSTVVAENDTVAWLRR
jgi:hypothetical protein